MPIFWDFFFYHKWILDFVEGFFCIYWDDHMVFIFQFVPSADFGGFLVVVVVLFSSCFRCRVNLSIQCSSCFLRYDCITLNLPLRTAFAESHRFWGTVFSLSFVSRNLLVSFLISSVTFLLFSNVLFNLHEFVFFFFFFFLPFFPCSWYLVS